MPQLAINGSPEEIITIIRGLVISPDLAAKVAQILTNTETLMAFKDDVIAKLQAQKTILDGVKTLLEQLTGIIKDNPGITPEAQAEILSLIDANSQEAQDALVANTPGGPVVPPTDTPAAG